MGQVCNNKNFGSTRADINARYGKKIKHDLDVDNIMKVYDRNIINFIV